MTKLEETKNRIISNFKDLQFEEVDHRYNLKGKDLSSVSYNIAKYKRKFDSENIAKGYDGAGGLLLNQGTNCVDYGMNYGWS